MTVESQIERLEDRLDALPSYDHPAAEALLERIAELRGEEDGAQ